MILTFIQDSCNHLKKKKSVIQCICIGNDEIFPAEAHSNGNGLIKGYFGASLLSFFGYRTIVNIVEGLVLYLDCSLPVFICEVEVEYKKNLTAPAL